MGLLDAYAAPTRARRGERLRARLRQEVTIRPVARRADGTIQRDATGKALFGPPVTYPAQVAGVAQLIRTASGAERASNTTVILAGGPAVSTEDELTLPTGVKVPILSIGTVPGPDGIHLTQLFT